MWFVNGLIGFVTGVVSSAVVAYAFAPDREKRRWRNRLVFWRRARVKLRYIDEDPVSTLADVAQAIGLRDVRFEYLFNDTPLDLGRLKGIYDKTELDFADDIPADLVRQVLADQREQAAKKKQTFDNDGTFSLKGISVSRLEGHGGGRQRIFSFYFQPSDYEHFVFPNLNLEKRYPHPSRGELATLREITGLDRSKLSLDKLASLPYHFKVGTNCVLVTCDGYMVLSVRSARQFVAPGGEDGEMRVHTATAEGMYRSRRTDSESDVLEGGEPNPFATVIRALRDELGLMKGKDFSLGDIGWTALFIDQLRAQPVFAFLLKCKTLSAAAVLRAWEAFPPDLHENESLLLIKWAPDSVVPLLFGERLSEFDYLCSPRDRDKVASSDSERKIVFASNHAAASTLAALVCDFPLDRLEVEAQVIRADRAS